MIEEIKGNLLETDCSIIAHGCNCQGVMGSGVAKALYEKWPEVKEKYLDYHFAFSASRMMEPKDLLGRVNFVYLENKRLIANCFTQEKFGSDGELYLNYEALETCLERLVEFMQQWNFKEVAMPKIGCGLAGGNWRKVKNIIKKTIPEYITVKVYIK